MGLIPLVAQWPGGVSPDEPDNPLTLRGSAAPPSPPTS